MERHNADWWLPFAAFIGLGVLVALCSGCEEALNLSNEKPPEDPYLEALSAAPGSIIIGAEARAGNLDTIGGKRVLLTPDGRRRDPIFNPQRCIPARMLHKSESPDSIYITRNCG